MNGLNDFVYNKPRVLPVILLLDTSGSMMEGGKISILNSAVNEMIESFKDLDSTNVKINVSIFTFGGEAKKFLDLTPAENVLPLNMVANGMTPMGGALVLAKSLLEDKDKIDNRSYRPVVILVSDGMPNDSWEQPLNDFKSNGRSSKCHRMAMGIGVPLESPQYKVLKKFITEEETVFNATDANGIRKFFKYVTFSISTRTKSQNPNLIPKPKNTSELNIDDDEIEF